MIWGTVVGILGGAVQDGISYFKDNKQKEQNHKQEIELERIRSENRVREFQAGLLQEQEKTKQAQLEVQSEEQKTFGIKAQSEASVGLESEKTVAMWFDNLTKATSYLPSGSLVADIANLFIATARPLITYLLGFLMFWIVMNHADFKEVPEWLQKFITMLGFQFEATISFWFYRRGSDKMHDLSSKKKV